MKTHGIIQDVLTALCSVGPQPIAKASANLIGKLQLFEQLVINVTGNHCIGYARSRQNGTSLALTTTASADSDELTQQDRQTVNEEANGLYDTNDSTPAPFSVGILVALDRDSWDAHKPHLTPLSISPLGRDISFVASRRWPISGVIAPNEFETGRLVKISHHKAEDTLTFTWGSDEQHRLQLATGQSIVYGVNYQVHWSVTKLRRSIVEMVDGRIGVLVEDDYPADIWVVGQAFPQRVPPKRTVLIAVERG